VHAQGLKTSVYTHHAGHRVHDPGGVCVEQLTDALKMIGKPEIIVRQSGDGATSRSLQHLIAMAVAAAERLRPV